MPTKRAKNFLIWEGTNGLMRGVRIFMMVGEFGRRKTDLHPITGRKNNDLDLMTGRKKNDLDPMTGRKKTD